MQLKSTEDTLRVLEKEFSHYKELTEIVGDSNLLSEMVQIITDFFSDCESTDFSKVEHMLKKLASNSYSWATFPGDKYPLAKKKFYGMLKIICKEDVEKVTFVNQFAYEDQFVVVFSALCLFLLSEGIKEEKQIPAPSTLKIVKQYKEIEDFYDAMRRLQDAQELYSLAANKVEGVGLSITGLKKYQPEITTLLSSLRNYVDLF